MVGQHALVLIRRDALRLEAGFKGQGPALIEEYGSTTLIWPGDQFEIGALGEIRIVIAAGDR